MTMNPISSLSQRGEERHDQDQLGDWQDMFHLTSRGRQSCSQEKTDNRNTHSRSSSCMAVWWLWREEPHYEYGQANINQQNVHRM